MSSDSAGTRHMAAEVVCAALGIAFKGVRLPVLLLLALLEPIVCFVCAGLALLGVLATVFFKLIGAPNFPALTMLAVSIGFLLVLVAYEGLIRVLSR